MPAIKRRVGVKGWFVRRRAMTHEMHSCICCRRERRRPGCNIRFLHLDAIRMHEEDACTSPAPRIPMSVDVMGGDRQCVQVLGALRIFFPLPLLASASAASCRPMCPLQHHRVALGRTADRMPYFHVDVKLVHQGCFFLAPPYHRQRRRFSLLTSPQPTDEGLHSVIVRAEKNI